MLARCTACHADEPSHPAFAAAPAGVVLESESDILANATRLHRQTVVLRAMPIGNLTGITEAERAVVECLVTLGTLRREQGQTGKALSLLDEAATLAVKAGEANLAFEACYQAYQAVEGRDG